MNVQDILKRIKHKTPDEHQQTSGDVDTALQAQAATASRIVKAPKLPRILFALVALAVCAILPFFVNNAIGYVPLFLLLILFALALIYVRLAGNALEHNQHAAHYEWIRGEEGLATITLTNTGVLPIFRIDANFVFSDMDGQDRTSLTTRAVLAGHETRDVGIDLVFDHIGVRQVGVESLEVFDFLGLFSKVQQCDERCLIRVVPRIYDLEKIKISETPSSDAKKSAQSVLSDDVDYAYVREYELGDPMKTVHWKLSARGGGQLYTKLFEMHNNPNITVVFDFYSTEAVEERRLDMYDTMLEGGFSLLNHVRERGVDAQVMFRDRAGDIRKSVRCAPEELDLLIGDMPKLSAKGSSEDSGLMMNAAASDPNGQSDYFYFTTEMSQQTAEALMGLKRNKLGVVVVAVVPPRITDVERSRRLRQLAILDEAHVPFVWIDTGADVWKAGV